MEGFAAVTVATGALAPVLKKLTALLGDEHRLQEGIRRDIESITSALGPVHDLLPKLWGREDLGVACKDWMMEARELSYDMEDSIDSLITPDLDSGDGGFIQRGNPFKEFMERVKGVAKRLPEMQEISHSIPCNRSKLSTDPRALFLHKDASELVGMEENMDELINLLQENEMVCIVGDAGVGKTALADLVYQAKGDEFQCRAFVSVHPSPDMMEILGAIRSQVTNNGAASSSSVTEPDEAEEDIIKDISFSLSDKKYLAIIDDIWDWEDWEAIRKVLPNNNPGCKIIMTTRIENIAERCRQVRKCAIVRIQGFSRADAERLSEMRLVKCGIDLEGDILYVCGMDLGENEFCPLAVICLRSEIVAASHVQGDSGECDTWARHVLHDGLLSTPSFEPLVQSLRLGFDDLPLELKTCLLSCSMYAVRHFLPRDWWVSKWIAEGFVSQEEEAQAYIAKLVSRNLFLEDGLVQDTYIVHPMMACFLAWKAKEDNFFACRWYNGISSHGKQIVRRLSLHCMDTYPDDFDVSRTRSLVIIGAEPQLDGVPFKEFKNLRVLEIYYCKGLENRHLVDICGLISLRCLVLCDCSEITELPREIGRLQNLETLRVVLIEICELPQEIEKLHHLETLDISFTRVTGLPMEIGKLRLLKTLDVRHTRITELPKEIGELHHLETLNISETNITELFVVIEKLQHLKTLNVSNTEITELPREITGLDRLENLDVSWTKLRELPKEFRKLKQLRTLDIRYTKVRELSCEEVPNSFLSVVSDFGYGQVSKLPLGVCRSPGDVENCREEDYTSSILVLFNHFGERCEVLQVPMRRVAGRHMNIPQWVKQDLKDVSSLDIRICKLGEDDLEFLKHMPNLQALELKLEVLPREPIAITGGGFLKLETFYVDCRVPLGVITFKQGAMPQLKHLELKFYTGTASQDYPSMGITHLPSLEKVVFRCSEYYTSQSPGISAMIDVVRKEAAEHPNEIALWLSGEDPPEVFDSGHKWISLAVIEKRGQLFSAAERRRARRN